MWLYDNMPFDDVGGYMGFVYLITNTSNGKQYIGKKLFTKAGQKQVKGKKKKIRKPSDWLEYYGSSHALLADIEIFGKEMFTRTILRLCKTRGECSYFEAKYQFQYEVLENKDKFYNDQIMCRVHRSHLKL